METQVSAKALPRPIKRLSALFSATLMAVALAFGTMAPAQAAVVVGVCTLKLGEAHASVHVSGTINALSSVKCTLAMPEVYIRTSLIKSNGPTWQAPVNSYGNLPPGKALSSNKAVSCAMGPGTYRSSTYVELHAPAGVKPIYHSNTYYTIWRSLACGVANRSASGTMDTVVDISVLSDGSVEFSDPKSVPKD